jgi:hypothetical protein
MRHNDQDPVGPQRGRLAPEQIQVFALASVFRNLRTNVNDLYMLSYAFDFLVAAIRSVSEIDLSSLSRATDRKG